MAQGTELDTTSPFDGIATRVLLTFRIDGDDFSEDPETGVEVATGEPVQLYVYLSKARNSEEVQMPGLDSTSVFMRGYCMEPMTIPEGIRSGLIADYLLTPEFGCPVEGKFIFYRVPPSSFPEVQEVLGDRIEGFLNIAH